MLITPSILVAVTLAASIIAARPVTGGVSNQTGPVTVAVGNWTASASGGASVSVVPGASSASNGKFFDPDTLNVSTGTTVTWMNDDRTLHTITSGSPEGGGAVGSEFDSSYIGAGKTFEHTFVSTGTFDYYCTLHPYMTGKVVVS